MSGECQTAFCDFISVLNCQLRLHGAVPVQYSQFQTNAQRDKIYHQTAISSCINTFTFCKTSFEGLKIYSVWISSFKTPKAGPFYSPPQTPFVSLMIRGLPQKNPSGSFVFTKERHCVIGEERILQPTIWFDHRSSVLNQRLILYFNFIALSFFSL